MADARIRAVITAQDNASAVVRGFGENVNKSSGKLQDFGKNAQSALAGIAAIGITAGLSLSKLVDVAGQSVDAANKNQAALIGLSSVARAFGQNQDEANQAARRLATDGLLTVTDAAKGLKNLLAAGFELPQAVKLMERFKDSAAFGRQSALSFGEAVSSATEGIKNGNSILVDNAGVTKNLSVILEEAGFSAQDLMKATTDVNVRQALFNGILKETNPQLGDAARLAETFAGKQAMLSAQTTILQQQLGTALQPVLLQLLQAITPIVVTISDWIQKNPQLAATLFFSAAAFAAVLAVLAGIAAIIGVVVVAFGAAAAAIAAAVAIAIAAVVALAVAVALNFGRIRSWFESLPAVARGALLSVAASLAGPLGPLIVLITHLDRVIALFNALRNAAAGGIQSVTSTLHNLKIPGFATGVENFSGGLAVVGERGPELVNLPRGSDVIPNGQVGSQTINVSFSGVFTGNEADMRKLAERVFRAAGDIAGAKNNTIAGMF
jgi:hypothetical protein